VLQGQNKPVYDELTLARLLEAAYVVQEHNRKLQALGLRIVPDDLQYQAPRDKTGDDQAQSQEDAAVAPTESIHAAAGAPAPAAGDDYTLTLARIVETQRQIQLRSLDVEQAIAMVVERVTAIARGNGAAVGMVENGKVRYPAASGLMTPPANEEIPAEKADGGLGFEGLSGPRGVADDLKKLHGVSPAIEKQLNDLGIFHFWQIAAFGPEAAHNVGEAVGLPGRVDGWIAEAKEFSAEAE